MGPYLIKYLELLADVNWSFKEILSYTYNPNIMWFQLPQSFAYYVMHFSQETKHW
jgi:hypothetical protein